VLDAATLTPANTRRAGVSVSSMNPPRCRDAVAMPMIVMAIVAAAVDRDRFPRLSRDTSCDRSAIDLTKTFGATLAVDHLNLTIKPVRSSACSARTAPARRRRSTCS
jgi:hypothetical protein